MKPICYFTVNDDMQSSPLPNGARISHMSFKEGTPLDERIQVLATIVSRRIIDSSQPGWRR